ncbi:MAG: hypothetical protein NC489_34525 [Ruminococcus flavefaciens]|nr:hypothetical protein [Ruminococcus flavefaciens]
MDAASSEKYAYNESNQLSETTICGGKTTKEVCYTYDEGGNLIQEYSPTAYYLYDPRGSVSGLTDSKTHLTKT